MTTYVRITSKESVDFNKVYPVRDHSEEYWQLDIAQPHKRYFDKSDCEVVAHLNTQPGIIIPDSLCQELKKKLCDLKQYDLAAEVRRYEKETPKSCPLPEGQHLITTEQLQAIHELLKQLPQPYAAIGFAETFPQVFAPAKTTYRIGDRFSITGSDYTYRIVHLFGNHIGLLCDESSAMHGDMLEVEDTLSITWGEMDELAECRFDEFTLLPESTDQMV